MCRCLNFLLENRPPLNELNRCLNIKQKLSRYFRTKPIKAQIKNRKLFSQTSFDFNGPDQPANGLVIIFQIKIITMGPFTNMRIPIGHCIKTSRIFIPHINENKPIRKNVLHFTWLAIVVSQPMGGLLTFWRMMMICFIHILT